jgi:DNA primase
VECQDKVDTSLSPEEQLLMLISHMNDIKKVTEAVHEQLTCPLLPPGFKRIADNWTNPEIIPFLQYLNKRGFTTEDIIVHNIGYITYSKIETPSHKTLTLKNHVVFLTHNDLGQVIYWNTRAIGDSFVKSVNAPAKDHEYSKGTAVFNLNRAKRCKELVITEGVPDALTLGISGVGTFGKQITDEQIQLITEDLTEDQKIYIMLDEDAKDKIYWLAERIKPYHKNTYMVINPYKKDANDLGKELAWKVIHEHSVKADGTGELIRLLN